MKFASIFLVVLCCGELAVAASPDRPNVLVFLVDDMGMMDTSVPMLSDRHGNPESHPLNTFYRTPSMERLAAQGTRMSQFYAMSVCSPSRIAIMTGQTSARHHTTTWIRPDMNNRGEFGPENWKWSGIAKMQATLPRLMASAGYRTIHCGKAHFGPNGSAAENPQAIGFDVNIGGSSIGQPGSYYAKQNFGNSGKRNRNGVPGLESYHGGDLYLTEVLTREMNREIEEAVRRDQPFFAYMAHYAVHSPFQADPRFVDNYAGVEPKLAAFASMIQGMDKSLGDILDKLDELGVADHTLVFFVGDNGTDSPRGHQYDVSCSAPLRGKKGTHYEGGMRVPFIASWAKPSPTSPLQNRFPIAQGRMQNDVAAIYDLFPTILAATGIDTETTLDSIDGLNLMPQLAVDAATGQGDSREEREFLMNFPHDHRSSYFTVLRQGDWKLIYHFYPAMNHSDDSAEPPRYQLFNLAADRDESDNLAAQEPGKLKAMLGSMRDALADTGAQLPLAADRSTTLEIINP